MYGRRKRGNSNSKESKNLGTSSSTGRGTHTRHSRSTNGTSLKSGQRPQRSNLQNRLRDMNIGKKPAEFNHRNFSLFSLHSLLPSIAPLALFPLHCSFHPSHCSPLLFPFRLRRFRKIKATRGPSEREGERNSLLCYINNREGFLWRRVQRYSFGLCTLCDS